MSDERMARPVSGEIMTDGQPGARAPRAGGDDVIDADFETIVPGGRAAPRRAEQPQDSPGESGGMDMLRGNGVGERAERRGGGPVFWTVGLALVAGAFWVSGGHAIVSQPDPANAPSTVTQFRQPLRIVNVVSRIDRRGERSFLLVDGEVANPGESGAAMPPLTIIVTGLDGRETRYNLGTNDKVLSPGERFAFSSRLHAPNEGVRTVTVDFKAR